jgi:hypothetical protein
MAASTPSLGAVIFKPFIQFALQEENFKEKDCGRKQRKMEVNDVGKEEKYIEGRMELIRSARADGGELGVRSMQSCSLQGFCTRRSNAMKQPASKIKKFLVRFHFMTHMTYKW